MPTFAKRTIGHVAVSVSALLAVLVFMSGCAGTGTDKPLTPGPVPSVTVSVSPAASSVQVGQTQNFTAVVTNDSQSKGLTWVLSGAGCSGAACGTLSSSFSASGAPITYTAPASVPTSATVTLTATSVSNTAKSNGATITVVAALPAIVVTLSPATATVGTGATQGFIATVTNDTKSQGVTWLLAGAGCSGSACGTLSATSTASGASVTYTAPENVPSTATVTLKAASVSDATKSAAATITLVAAPAAIAVAVSPTPVDVPTSGSQSFTATVLNDSQNKGVNWTLSGIGCSNVMCGTLSATSSASGAPITYTAPATLPSSTGVILTATSVADSTKSAAATITVTSPNISVTVAPIASSVQLGQTQTFTATVTNDSQSKGVTWGLSGAGCSGTACGTLSAASSRSGSPITYMAPANVPSPPGVAMTVTSVADSTKSATATITVVPAPGTIVVVVSPTSASVPTGASQNFTATVQNDSQNRGVVWELLGASCGESDCGSLSASFSASSVAITYTAPAIKPDPAAITLRVTSVSDSTKSVAVTIIIM